MKKRLCVAMVALLLMLPMLVSCGEDASDQCPRCSATVDFARETFCANCGIAFSEYVPDGYEEPSVKEIQPVNDLVGAWSGATWEGDPVIYFFYPDYSLEVLGDPLQRPVEVFATGSYAVKNDTLIVKQDGFGETEEVKFEIAGDMLTVGTDQFIRIGTSSGKKTELEGKWVFIFGNTSVGSIGYSDDAITFYQDGTVKIGENDHGTYSIVHDGEAIHIDMDRDDEVFTLDMRIGGVMRLTNEYGYISVYYLDETVG